MKFMLVVISLLALNAHAAPLAGGWQLDRFEITKDGATKPFCLGMTGSIHYSTEGFMSVNIKCRNAQGLPAEAYGGRLYYSADFQIDGDKVIHKVRKSNVPSLVGRTLIRRIETLTPRDLVLTGLLGEGESLRIWFHRMGNFLPPG